MARTKSVIQVQITGDSRDLRRATGEAERSLSDLAVGFGLLAAKAATALVGIGAGAVREFASFNDAMTRSTAIMGDLTSAMTDEMSQAARDVAKETTFAANEVAEGFFFLASAGLSAEQSLAALPRVARFAQAGAFDLAMATDLATDAQSALGLTVDDASQNMQNLNRVLDVLVGANTLANATTEQFSRALTNKAAAALKITNKELEEGVAVLAFFADQGVKGAEAGERLSVFLRDVSRAAANNSDEFKKLGLQVADADGNLRNMADIIDEFDGLFAGMSDLQRDATLDMLGLTRSVADNIKILSGGGEAIRGYQANLETMGGIVDEVASKQLASFSAQASLVFSQFRDVLITIGEQIAEPLGELFTAILDNRENIEEFGRRAGTAITNFVTDSREKLGEAKAFWDENVAGPVDAAETAIINFATAARERLNSIIPSFRPFGEAFRELFDPETVQYDASAEQKIANTVSNLIQMFVYSIKLVKGDITRAFDELLGDVDWFGIGKRAVDYLAVLALGLAAGIFKGDWLMPVFDAVRDNFGTILLAAIGIALAPAKVIGPIANFLRKIPLVGKFLGWIVQSLNRVGEGFRSRMADVVKVGFNSFLTALRGGGPGLLSRFGAFLSRLPQAVSSMADDLALRAMYAVENFAGSIGTAVNGVLGRLAGFLRTLMRPFANFGRTMIDDLFALGRNLMDALAAGIRNAASAVYRAVRAVARTVWDDISSFWQIRSPSRLFMGLGEDAMKGLALGLSGSQQMIANVSADVAMAGIPSIDVGGGQAAGRGPVTVNVTVTSADPDAVVQAIRRYTRYNGPLGQVVTL